MSAPSLSNKTRFLQIRKSCESGMHLGYRLGIIVSVLHAYFMFSGKGRRDYVLSAAKKILKTPVLTFAENGGAVSIYYSIRRDDYVEMLDFVRDELAGLVRGESIYVANKERRSSFFECFSVVRPAFKLCKSLRMSWFEKLYCFASYCYLLKGVAALEKSVSKFPERAIFFNSSNFPESMLCEFFRLKGVKTYSLQHGMYLNYSSMPFDVINYANTMADVLLCWGEASRFAIDDFYRDNGLRQDFQCVVAGYPRDNKNYGRSTTTSEAVLVLLPRILYKKQSLALLSILAELEGTSFLIKLHPSLSGDNDISTACARLNAEVLGGTLSDCLTSLRYKAVIGFNSASLFEALSCTDTCLMYDSGFNEYQVEKMPMFTTRQELQHLFSSGKEGVVVSYEYFFGPPSRCYAAAIVNYSSMNERGV